MKRFEYDPETQDGWRSYPVRFAIARQSECHNKPLLLTQSMSGGFVSANCPECGAKDKSGVGLRDVLDLNLWVSCPECKARMEVCKLDKNYCFVCDRCQIYIRLSDILPHYYEVA